TVLRFCRAVRSRTLRNSASNSASARSRPRPSRSASAIFCRWSATTRPICAKLTSHKGPPRSSCAQLRINCPSNFTYHSDSTRLLLPLLVPPSPPSDLNRLTTSSICQRSRYTCHACSVVSLSLGTLVNSTVQRHISRCRTLTGRPRCLASFSSRFSRLATTPGGHARHTRRPSALSLLPTRPLTSTTFSPSLRLASSNSARGRSRPCSG